MGALDEFRAQREVAEDVRAKLAELSKLLADIRTTTDSLVHDDRLVRLLDSERKWLEQAEVVIEKARAFREHEVNRFWPAVVRRWTVAIALVSVTGFAAAAGHA